MTSPTLGGTDFEATPRSMRVQARTLTAAADEFEAVPQSLLRLECATDDIFGEGGAAAAYTDFLGQWTAEMGVQIEALREVSRACALSADNYDKLDRSLHDFPVPPDHGRTE